LNECRHINLILINMSIEFFKNKIPEYLQNSVKCKNDVPFTMYLDDIDKINNNKQFCRLLLKWLGAKYKNYSTHKSLINKLKNLNTLNTKCMQPSELQNIRNTVEIFSMEEIQNIPYARLVLIEELNGTYDAFDVIELRKYLFGEKKNEYKNPLTTNKISEFDMNKILKVNIRELNYFA